MLYIVYVVFIFWKTHSLYLIYGKHDDTDDYNPLNKISTLMISHGLPDSQSSNANIKTQTINLI